MFSTIYYLYFVISGLIGIVIATIIRLVTFPFDPDALILHRIASLWIYHYLRLNPGWKIELSGDENIDKNTTYVIVANHQSVLDVLLLHNLPIQFKWTAKTWVFRFPIAGLFLLLAGHMRISSSAPQEVLAKCEYWLSKKVSVLLFPEGTRSTDGNLLPFKYGAFYLAAKNNIKILPILIEGTRDILPKGSLRLAPSGRISISILESVAPERFQFDENKLLDHVFKMLDAKKKVCSDQSR